jgi:amino acid adenylation domain-containing protein
VRHREHALTYAQLNGRANQLARELGRRGVGPEVRVAVCVEPSLDIAIALLAIFKAGGVYVPVEPTYPAARIAAILDEAAAPVLLCADELATRLGLLARPRLALASLPPLAAADAEGRDLDLAVAPTQAASIYYTSGTTGRPKGVVATQANVTTYILTAQRRYAISPAEVMPAIARFSFSISMFELMSPLAAGGTLVVLDRDHVLDLPRLAATLQTVTFFHMGPSLLRQLLPYLEAHGPGPAAYAGVRHASSGGDLVGPEVLEGLKRHFPAAEVFVIYGCSEISCMGLTYPAPRDLTITKTFVGRPFEDVAVRIVDGLGQRVPVGVVGEIQFAGGGLTRGYLERAELTAEKFVVHDGRRWYRTGDLGRVSAHGWVEIAGRNDFQIKIRGMRLELAEVEVHLRRAPGVRDAVAMGKPGPSGEPQLVAYVVPVDGAAPEPDQVRARAAAIRRYMVDHLPDYMVPAVVVELARLPLNHNLKVDRFALPDPPAPGQRGAVAPAEVPLSATEQVLAQLWCRLLELPAVSVADNFFDLGGESLGAQELIAEVERQLGVRLLGMDVLRESLEVLAAICDAARGPAAPRAARAPVVPAAAMAAITTFHFGDDDSLYGALHHDGAAGARAVLVCGAAGQEQVRAHFVLGRLARQLATRGVPTMRFDYHGVGDSPGHGPIAAITRWQRDVLTAAAELRRRTGARELIVVGVRLGALLLESVRDRLAADRIVLWDPVGAGEVYYQELAAMQRRHLAGIAALRRGRRAQAAAGVEALVGTEFTAAAIRELRRLRPAPLAAAAPPTARLDSRQGLGYDCGWTDVTRMEDILSDAGFSRRLVALCLGEEPA